MVGEIINPPEEIETRKKLTQAMQNIFDRINTDHIGSLMASFGMIRGNTFAGVILAQFHAPQIMQNIIKAAYSIEGTALCISVALGQLTVTSHNRNEIDGPAFHAAFDNLEKLKKHKSNHWLQIVFATGQPVQPLVGSNVALLAAITEGWTDKQREIVWAMERYGQRQNIVGKMLGIKPSVISKQLKAANHEVYRRAWDGLTAFLAASDNAVNGDFAQYFNLGVHAFEVKKDFSEAMRQFNYAYEAAKRELEPDNPLYIPIYNKLAMVFSMQGNNEEASSLTSLSLNLLAKLPKTQIYYAETFLINADINHKKFNHAGAEDFYQKALALARNIFTDSHPFIAKIYNNLANLYRGMGRFERALELFENALQILKSNPEIPATDHAIMQYNIACLHHNAKNNTQAIAYAQESLYLLENHLPANHEYTELPRVLLARIGE